LERPQPRRTTKPRGALQPLVFSQILLAFLASRAFPLEEPEFDLSMALSQ
jgi:hypothetical protein